MPSASTSKTLTISIQTLANAGARRHYKKSAIILNEGDAGDTMLVLLEGSVRVYGTNAQGREVTYGNIDAPSYFGEMSLDGGPRSASIEALTACVCSVVSCERVRQYLSTQPELATELIHKIISRARAATNTVRSMALLDSYGRLRETLEELSGPADTQGLRRIKPGTTHASLAQRIGSSREMVSKIIRDLDKGGYLRSEGRSLWVCKKLPSNW